jgi:hypothetical protein
MATAFSFYGWFVKNVLNRFRSNTSNTSNTSNVATKRTGSGTIRPNRAFDLIHFNYTPVSSKEVLPIFDRTPCGLLIRETQIGGKNMTIFLNLHWLTNPRALLTVLRMRQNAMNPHISPALRGRYLQQMIALASQNQPQSAVRNYISSRLSDWGRIPPEVAEDVTKTLTQLYPAHFRENQNP